MRTLARTALPLLVAAGLAASAEAQVLFREDFENGLANWTAAGLWHVEDDSLGCAAPLVPFPSGTHAAWFGSAATCNYAPSPQTVSWSLSLVTPVQLPASGAHAVLRFRRMLDTESCAGGYDVSGFSFSVDGGANWNQQSTFDCRPNGLPWSMGLPWVTSRAALDALAGQAVLVRFSIRVDPPFDEGLGWFLDDVEIAVEPGTVSCTATTITCPCQNAWDTTSPVGGENYGGCKNSRRAEAVLYGDGVASVSNDSAVLRVADMLPGAPALLVQSTTTASVLFGDGRRCLGGTQVRLWTHTGTQPIESFPGPTEPGLALRGGIPSAGGVMHYQVVYRDAATWCTSATWNTSNAYRIEWAP